ncbi:hypothetical protein [Allofrancisella inopinata]|uniref:hypothetical protein n=1 Tax=Allofrancisella inopinata TaxID=1085647 RepID=UPI003C7C7F40
MKISIHGLAALGYLGVASQYIYTDMQSIAPSLFSAHTQAKYYKMIFFSFR